MRRYLSGTLHRDYCTKQVYRVCFCDRARADFAQANATNLNLGYEVAWVDHPR